MSELNRPGFSGSPPKHPGRVRTPPRTLPSQLDGTCPFTFDQRPAPFSPTSPSEKRSPGRPRTMKEYEEELTSLKKENFNLKLRIFFIEQNRSDLNLPKDVNELRLQLTNLKVDFESKKKELSDMEDLILKTYKVLDIQKNQLEAIKSEHETERQTLLNKIGSLEKELKDYHMKFMETSVHLDDTNALYAMTFGLGSKADMRKTDDDSNEKVRDLEDELAVEKEKVMILEGENAHLKTKLISDQDELKRLEHFVEEIKNDLGKLLRERNEFEVTANEAMNKLASAEGRMKNKMDDLKQKEIEIDNLKTQLKTIERRLSESSRQEEHKSSEPQRKALRLLTIENRHLKDQIKEIQKQHETKNGSSTELSTESGCLDQDRELNTLLRNSELKIEEQRKEIAKLRSAYDNSQALIQALVKDNKTLKRGLEVIKASSRSHSQGNSSKEEERKVDELIEKMTTEKDSLISELYCKIEELTKALQEKECEESSINDREKELEELTTELDEKKKEVDNLKRELKKKTFNLQGLVNTELWDKNREIEKLNKVCERKHLEVLALQKQLRDHQKTVSQDKVTSFVSSFSLQNGLFTEDKENLQPVTDPMIQIQQLIEEKRLLSRKVEELQARLLNTPERDTESLLMQTLRNERDQAEKLRKEAVNACLLLTTRLQELADFLDSLLPSLCGKKRKVVQQAVERSRELSRSLSLAAEDSSVMHCSAWSDLQPSLYVPLLPDISTVDFWSGEEEEAFSGGQEVAKLKSQVETLTEEVKIKDGEIARFQSEKQSGDSSLFKSIFGYRNQNSVESVETNFVLNDIVSIAHITEGSLANTFNDQQRLEKNQSHKCLPEVKSANIGRITVSSKKKDANTSHNFITFEDQNKTIENERYMSEYETWSEPDRDVSFARMGLKENSTNVNKMLQCKFDETSETASIAPKSPSPRRISEVQRLQRKVNGLEQVNEALKNELVILHQLTPTTSRQDKATSIEFSRESLSSIPSHLLEEIRIQREKLEASLFHNDYIRRQLESTVSTLHKKQVNDLEMTTVHELRDVTKQLGQVQSELSELQLEKEQWNTKNNQLQLELQKQTSELLAKQCELLEFEKNTNEKLQGVREKYERKCSQAEEKCEQLLNKLSDLEREKEKLVDQIAQSSQEVTKLTAEIKNYDHGAQKDKQTIEDLNNKVQQLSQKKVELQRIVSEQEQLMSDAERERQELATQLIARDRQVSELQKQLSQVELASNELESALRTQLDAATHQCAQFETKIRDMDSANMRRVEELQRRLDAARFAHSEAVLQYTRVANDNIRLQQQLRTRSHEPSNETAQVEKIKCALEVRVVQLEAVNTELKCRLASLNIARPLYSDSESNAGSCKGGSHRRKAPPPLTLPASPPHTAPIYNTQRSQDLTSDYLSDQDATPISSSQTHTRHMWSPTSPLTHMSTSPDLGIESDHGHLSSLENIPRTNGPLSLRATPVNDLIKLEEENTQLRRNLQKTRQALQETLAQLTSANHHKRQYEAQLSAANQQKAKVERAICRQINKTHSILKKARVNLEEDGKGEQL